jgi:hypothetical protein
MIPRYHHDPGVREIRSQPAELNESVQNRGIRRAHGVKHVAGDEDEVGLELDYLVDHPPHRGCDIGLTLVDARGSLSLVLPEAEMYVCEVNQSHRARIALIHCVIFVRTCIGPRA